MKIRLWTIELETFVEVQILLTMDSYRGSLQVTMYSVQGIGKLEHSQNPKTKRKNYFTYLSMAIFL